MTWICSIIGAVQDSFFFFFAWLQNLDSRLCSLPRLASASFPTKFQNQPLTLCFGVVSPCASGSWSEIDSDSTTYPSTIGQTSGVCQSGCPPSYTPTATEERLLRPSWWSHHGRFWIRGMLGFSGTFIPMPMTIFANIKREAAWWGIVGAKDRSCH